MMKLKLNAKQAEDLPFPVGCPVWYNFSGESSGDVVGTGEPPILKRGVVESVSVSFSSGANDLVYDVTYSDADGKKGKVVEEVSEHKLAYGSNCPVTIEDTDGDRSAVEGTILLCEASSIDSGKMIYTAMIFMEGGEARFEAGIESKRIKYRGAKTDTAIAPAESSAASPTADSVQKKASSTAKTEPLTAKASAIPFAVTPCVEEVPSSITCDSVAKEGSRSSKDGRPSSGKKRAHRSEAVSPLTINPPKKNIRMDTGDRSSHAHNKPGSRGSIASHSHDSAHNKPDNHRTLASRSHTNVGSSRDMHNNDSRIVMTIPKWLQRDLQAQRGLFFHLIGSKHDDKRWKRNVSHVERETNCSIVILFNNTPSKREDRPYPPITITIDSCSRSSAFRDINDAREKIQQLLLNYMDIMRDENSKGRLFYELSSSCIGDHRPRDSSSHAVRAGDGSFVTLLELPFSDRTRTFHGHFLLQKHILGQCKSIGCIVKVTGNDFGLPLKCCDPYVLVSGRHWQAVDQAVVVLRASIAEYIMDKSPAFRFL